MNFDATQVAKASALREQAQIEFADLVGPETKCNDTVEGGRYSKCLLLLLLLLLLV